MNTTDAEIAGMVEGIRVGNVEVKASPINKHWVDVILPSPYGPDSIIGFSGNNFLTLCRAVVGKVDGEKYTMDEMQIYAKEYAECGRMNTSDPSVHQEGVGTSSDEAHGIIRGTT